ncbi:hypothetical protein [Sphingomonas gei]|uniref:hypothetical protein n=1 Tax=Sphingomonas gei TaxID=1395960 RepID=UPI001F0D644D|nr:hypothetical protein [Sphingomonas gei]
MKFISLKAINGEPILINVTAVRTVSSIDLAGVEMGVIGFDKTHEVVVGSTVAEVIEAIAGVAGLN